METESGELWRGLRNAARLSLETRDYSKAQLPERLGAGGVTGAEAVAGRDDLAEVWIPGVELIPRQVHRQPGRGYFAELTRLTEGVLATIGLEPRQWSAALMHRASAKGFHVHPPFVPKDHVPAAWFRDLYVENPGSYAKRPYDREQWDVMFFLTSICEMILVDEREGLPRRVMRFTIHGDEFPGASNVAVVIPPGVAHAIRNIGKDDLSMVYGTSTTFRPDWEGRLFSGVELSLLPPEWESYLAAQ